MSTENSLQTLHQKAVWLWKESLRLHALEPGVRIASSLSCIELLTVLYYGGFIKYNAADPLWVERDRLITSKGHGAVTLYPILAELGFFPASELDKIGSPDSFLGMIPDPAIPGFETINGSLGHGLGVGLGMAISLERKHIPAKVLVLHGDGELGEGSVWEAISLAGDLNQNNLFLLLDVNKKSMLGTCRKTADDWESIFRSFSWYTVRCDGHDIPALQHAMSDLFLGKRKKPAVLIAETIKGHGVPELEKSELAHVMSLKPERIHELISTLEALS